MHETVGGNSNEIKLIELEEVKLNKLNLIIAALYRRCRKSEDSWLSGFWARLIVGLAMLFLLLTFLEVILVLYGQEYLRNFIAK